MKLIRIVLIPFAMIYSVVLSIRHFLYDRQWLRSEQFNHPVICVGNLSFGGTGKTPFTIFLARLLGDHPQLAILSRGYKRKTKGFVIADTNSTVHTIGDEPLLMYAQLRNTSVAVDANRCRGLKHLFEEYNTETAILDDALQHRKVKAGMNILLTDYHNLYTCDRLVPAGNLRDIKHRARKVQMIVVTKCPDDVDFSAIRDEIAPRKNQHLFFTRLRYQNVRPLLGGQLFDTDFLKDKGIVLFTGIAQPRYLEAFIQTKTDRIQTITFPDHHDYSRKDIESVTEIFDNFDASSKMVVTTEKDAIKLAEPSIAPLLIKLPVFVLTIEIEFLKDGDLFEREIKKYVEEN